MRIAILAALCLLALCPLANASEILFLVPFPGPSHWLMIKHFITELISRGHKVTCVTSFKFGENLTNYNEVLIDPVFPLRDMFPVEQMFDLKYGSDFENLFLYWRIGLASSSHGLANEKVQNMIKRDDLHFDLIVSEQFFQESWLMFAFKYNAPIVTIGTYGYSDFMDRAMGLLTPWSHVPHMLLNYEDNMTFTQRSYNALISSIDYVIRKFHYIPNQEEIAKKYFSSLVPKHGPLPSVVDLEKSISVMLINNHEAISKPRPSMTGLVNIAGAHIQEPEALPKNIQEFLDNAKDGAIYFSLGAYMQSSAIPPEKIKTILKVFSALKQRVLWKFEDDSLTNLPKNVMVQKWMPQNDILAHKNVVLFISHGGLFGTLEGLYRGKPTLFMPFFGDQHRNSVKAQRNGYALQLLFTDITEETLSSKLKELIENKKYLQRARELSSIFRDNIMHPMEQSMYWMEYVIRHKGAKHLKSAAINLSICEYLMLDIVGFYAAIVLSILFLVYKFFKCLCRRGVKKEKKN